MEQALAKRLQARLARLDQRRTWFESKLRARIAKADGVQADPAAKRSERRKAVGGVRRWEQTLEKLKRFPKAVPARHTSKARSDDGDRVPRARPVDAADTGEAGRETVSDGTRGIWDDGPDGDSR